MIRLKGVDFFLAIACFLISCDRDDGINLSNVKVYATNSGNFDVLALDVFSISNNDYIVCGICGNSPDTKFDGDSLLYFRRVNGEGRTLWDTCFTASSTNNGFPSNIVRLDEEMLGIFWNTGTGRRDYLQFDIDNQGIVLADIQQGINCNFDCGIVMLAAEEIVNNKIDLLGIGFDPLSDQPTSYNSKYNLDIGMNSFASQRLFNSGSFGGTGSADLNLLKTVENFLSLKKIDNRLLIAGPIQDQMELRFVGESSPIYRDAFFWVASIEELQENNNEIALVLGNRKSPTEPSYLLPSLDIGSLAQVLDFQQLLLRNESLEIFNLDPQSEIILQKLRNGSGLVIAGTSRTGIPIIYTYDGNTLNSELFGEVSRYEVGGIVQSADESRLVMVGTTKIENRRQRIFLIDIDTQELLN